MSEYVQAEISLNETTRDLFCELIDVLRDRLPGRPAGDTKSAAEVMVESLSRQVPICPACGKALKSGHIHACAGTPERPEPSPAPEGDEISYAEQVTVKVNAIREASKLRAEVERLTRERDEAPGIGALQVRIANLKARAEQAEKALANAREAREEDISHLQRAWEAAGSRGEGHATLSAFIKRTLEQMDGYRISLAATERALAEARAADGEATSLLRELDAAKEERDAKDLALKKSAHLAGKHLDALAAAESREKSLAHCASSIAEALGLDVDTSEDVLVIVVAETVKNLSMSLARETRLREALVTYGCHNTACDVVTKGATAPCDCGLDAALARDGGE